MKTWRMQRRAAALVKAHLGDQWCFNYHEDNRPQYCKHIGACQYDSKQIRVRRSFANANDWVIVKHVILHEIAHAKAGQPEHNTAWAAIALGLGCEPAVTANQLSVPIII